MMSSGTAQNQRPASAPGEEAPLAESADKNEVKHLSGFYFHLTAPALGLPVNLCFLYSVGVARSSCISESSRLPRQITSQSLSSLFSSTQQRVSQQNGVKFGQTLFEVVICWVVIAFQKSFRGPCLKSRAGVTRNYFGC